MEDYTYHFSRSGDKVLGAICLKSALALPAEAAPGDTTAFDRRQSRSRALAVRYDDRPGGECFDYGYGQSLPHGGE